MPLLDHNEGDWRLVSLLQLPAGLPHGHKLLSQNGQELALAAAVTEDDNLLRLATSVALEEFHQQLLCNVLHVLDDLLSADEAHVLNPHLDLVVDCFWIHASHDGGDAWLDAPSLRGWVTYIRPHDHDRPLEHAGSAAVGQHVVHATELGVDLEADVGDDLSAELTLLVEALLEAALGGDTKLHLGNVFDSVVHQTSLEREHNDNQVQELTRLLEPRLDLLKKTFNLH